MHLHRPKPQNLWQVLKYTFTNFIKHAASVHSAAIAFLSLSSMAPVLVLAVALSGMFYGAEAAQGEVVQELQRLIGREGAVLVQEVLAKSSEPATNRWAAAISFVTLLVGATAVFAQLQDSLNTIWEVCPKPGFFLRRLLKKRLLCFGLVIGIGFLVVTSLAASAALAAVQKILEARLQVGLATLVGWADVVLSWLLMTALFAMIYRILPDIELEWRDVAFGSGVTAVLFAVGKYLIGFYLARATVASTYGAAGSLVVILLWVYYSAMIFLWGAELTRVHSRRYREGRAAPEPGAVRTVTITEPVEA
jgi:membrane protein